MPVHGKSPQAHAFGGLQGPTSPTHSMLRIQSISKREKGVVCDTLDEVCALVIAYSRGKYTQGLLQNDVSRDYRGGGGDPVGAQLLAWAAPERSPFEDSLLAKIRKGDGNFRGSWDYDGPGPFFKGNLEVNKVGDKYVLHARQVRAPDPDKPLAQTFGKPQSLVAVLAQLQLTPVTEGVMVVDYGKLLPKNYLQGAISQFDENPGRTGCVIDITKDGVPYSIAIGVSMPYTDKATPGEEIVIERNATRLVLSYDPAARCLYTEDGHHFPPGATPPLAVPSLSVSITLKSTNIWSPTPVVKEQEKEKMEATLREFVEQLINNDQKS